MAEETYDVAARLRAVVAILGNQVKAARRIAISQAALSNYVRGATAPPPDVLERLAKAANVRLEWLLEGHGAFFSEQPRPPRLLDTRQLTDGNLLDLLHEHLVEQPDFAELVMAELRRTAPGGIADAARRTTETNAAERPDDDDPPPILPRRPLGGTVIPADDYDSILPEFREAFVPIIGYVAAGPAFEWNENTFPPRTANEYVEVKAEVPGGFAMRVKGGSMEPELPEGSIALFGGRLQLTAEPAHGQPALAVYEDSAGRLRYTVKMVSAEGKTVRMTPLSGKPYSNVEVGRDQLHALYTVIGPITTPQAAVAADLPLSRRPPAR